MRRPRQVHAQGPDVFPIPGTKRIKYLEENAAAFLVQLSAEEKAQLEHIFAADKARRLCESCQGQPCTSGCPSCLHKALPCAL